jgi:5-methylcytosine-specific restriction endonuclease McrBC GTP-binding regulatory subunit McrB
MYYRIKIKMPKSKIVQYDMPAPISVNDLSTEEFDSLLKYSKDHITLLSQTKFASKQIFIERLSPEKATQLTQFYSSSPVYFADENTPPTILDHLSNDQYPLPH